MYFLDVNTMIGEWAYQDLRFSTAKDLLGEMKRLGIVRALVFHSRSWLYDPVHGNESIVKEAKSHNSLVPVMVLTSLIQQEFGGRRKVLQFIKDNGIAAARLFPMDHNYCIKLWNINDLFSIMDDIRMPVMIDMKNMDGSLDDLYPDIYEVASCYRNTPIILLTVGYRSLRNLYSLLEKCPNIYLDTSTFITFRGIEDIVRSFGSHRILFGTRMPFIEGGVSVGRLIYADISAQDKENIAYQNIVKLLDQHELLCSGDREGF